MRRIPSIGRLEISGKTTASMSLVRHQQENWQTHQLSQLSDRIIGLFLILWRYGLVYRGLAVKSIWGGISISIASYVYLQTGGIIGAFLFSIGLLIILNMEFPLFTGIVGYIDAVKYVRKNVIVLLGNIIGCQLSSVFCHTAASDIVLQKVNTSAAMTFLESVLCGMLIYIAVECFRKRKDYMVTLCVAAFILSGAEHCIADLCFILIARQMSIEAIRFLSIVTLGNSIGAILTYKVNHWR
ncbi:formate/nitrite transporter family protein [Bacteroides acidifaciens]|uniref:formate/nitrite transporter family protein n=1 Tax=Bacteroides acidifaciens TaxID=85831 RepID=UPI00248BDD43|nr:formate/nitrite transporter family protein [Bacteroides acidifaciens]